MIAELLHRIMTKIRRPGPANERAGLMVRVIVNGGIIVAMVQGMMRIRKCSLMTGSETGYCGQVAAAHYYAPFSIHRKTPVHT